jgi:hypothetical protein
MDQGFSMSSPYTWAMRAPRVCYALWALSVLYSGYDNKKRLSQ